MTIGITSKRRNRPGLNPPFNFVRSAAAFVICLTAGILVANAASHASTGRGLDPKADVHETRYDFGEVFMGEGLTHTFGIHNTGTEILQLSQAAIPVPRKKSASLLQPGAQPSQGPDSFAGILGAGVLTAPLLPADSVTGETADPGAAPS